MVCRTVVIESLVALVLRKPAEVVEQRDRFSEKQVLPVQLQAAADPQGIQADMVRMVLLNSDIPLVFLDRGGEGNAVIGKPVFEKREIL
jgi:hypothetical protein